MESKAGGDKKAKAEGKENCREENPQVLETKKDSRERPSLKAKGLRHNRPRICNTGNSQGPGKTQN